MIPASTSEFILKIRRPNLPASYGTRSLAHEGFQTLRRFSGETSSFLVIAFCGIAGEVIEKVRDVFGDGFVGGEETDVGVEVRRDRIVIARGEADITSNCVPLAADTIATLQWILRPSRP